MKANGVVGAVVLAFALVSSSALAQTVVRNYQIGMQVDVDARGQVAHVGTPDELPQALVNAVRQTASHWRFKPIEVGGHPVSASTWVNATVQVVKRADGRFGVQTVYDRNGPRLPVRQMMSHMALTGVPLEGAVSLQVAFEVKPDGSMHVLRLLKHDGPGYRTIFEAARKAIETAHAVPMRANGRAIVSNIQMTFGFCSRRDSGPDCTRHASGGEHAATASSPMSSGQQYAVDNALHFLPANAHATAGARKSTSG